MKKLLVLPEDELHAREISLEILTGTCAGLHKPNGQTIADKMLFMVAVMAAERERELSHERTMGRPGRCGRSGAALRAALCRRIHPRHRPRPP